MKSNFFTQIAQMNLTGDLQLTVKQGADNNYIVSVLLRNDGCGDKAKNHIPPLNLRGTPDELDEGFFENVTPPLQTASGLMVDMDAFLKQMEEAKRKSAMEKEKADREKKEKEAKEKKYKEAMAKVDELDKGGKPHDAWTKLPNPTDFPEYEEAIKKRRSELSAKFAPDLFAAPVQEEKPEPPKEGHYPDYASEGVEEEMQFEDSENEY